MKISSPAFSNNGKIPAKYTCDGENINPPLLFSGVPVGVVTLALICEDPDAPGKIFAHWTVWNIDPNTTEIGEGMKLQGATEGLTDFGKNGWGGPCPPSGTHRFFFKLYALDKSIDLAPQAPKQQLEAAMQHHILEQVELVGLYSREK
jgi:Raf kinase inhibitor-like YbhB/YbcL family protein